MGRAAAFWCAVTAAAAALAAGFMLCAMQAGANVAAFAASAVALIAMALLPPMFARRFGSLATLPCAAALVLTMGAMRFAATPARTNVIQSALLLLLVGFALVITLVIAARMFHSEPILLRRNFTRYASFIRPGNGALVGAALLAGMSSGVLARFQLFSLCGADPFSFTHLFFSLGAALGAGAWLQRSERRHALLLLFALRGALLAALTLDAFSSLVLYAASAFAVLDALTLPTLLRNDHAGHVAQGGCPGIAHHLGMLAGAAFSTTSWGFGEGFYALFLGAAALNLVCASTQMARPHPHTLKTHPSSGIDFRQSSP
ncbi:hypothetical protein [Paraburkholderia bannensis]|uniref:hypothetical protein n=1 Tax=Paraburkholderia bannensis TaxID=765414 RepID=UPI000488BD65|nr:hypothetical protein [Paraburkholderia bannensis]